MADYNNRTNFNTRSNPSDNTNTNGIMLKNHDKHKFLACSHWNKGVVMLRTISLYYAAFRPLSR